jgi:hypothetical protein
MNNQTQLTDDQANRIFRSIDTTKLGPWEKEFVESVRSYWQKNHRLSDKQSKRLVDLWRKQQGEKPPS